MFFMPKERKKLLLIALAAVLLVCCAFGVYVGDYYHKDEDAVDAMSQMYVYDHAERLADDTLVYYPYEYDSAMIFYPGGKVDTEAYIPLMERCAQEGVMAILVPMPFRLAVLDMDAAADIPAQFPEVEHWYMAGHSLGGSMAASFTAETDWVEGLILLAAYSTVQIDVPVLSIYGSEDGVLNLEKYDQYRANLPADFTEVILEGGNHAQFGVYGEQDGDGAATMTNAEQIEQTAELIGGFIYGDTGNHE